MNELLATGITGMVIAAIMLTVMAWVWVIGRGRRNWDPGDVGIFMVWTALIFLVALTVGLKDLLRGL